MANLFGAIDVGSHEIELKIFELSKKNGIRQVDDIIHLIDLGTDTYNDGRISFAHVAEIKRILLDFKRVMDSYGVTEYRAYGTSAFRDMENSTLVLRQIEQETGIHVGILANSEQRFLDYKSIASKGEAFNRVIEKGTAIVDVGGGSIQISLFAKDRLVLTQNLVSMSFWSGSGREATKREPWSRRWSTPSSMFFTSCICRMSESAISSL